MPLTVLELSEVERQQVTLLCQPFENLLFLQQPDPELIARTRAARRRGFKSQSNLKEKARFLRTVTEHLAKRPCTVLEAIQARWVFERITGLETYQLGGNPVPEDWTWNNHYKHMFDQWQQDNGLDTFQTWDICPAHVAGYYHLQQHGDRELPSLLFTDTLACAVLYEVLHREGIRTLTALATLSVPQLYGYIRQSSYDDENQPLRAVRAFLHDYYLEIETVIEDTPST